MTHFERIQSIMAGEGCWRECEGAGYIVSGSRKRSILARAILVKLGVVAVHIQGEFFYLS